MEDKKNSKKDKSENQIKFEMKYHKEKQKVKICRVAIIVLFLVIWEYTSAYHIIDPFFFSSPTRLIQYFWKSILQKDLFLHIGISLYETLFSFALIMILSVFVAFLLWRFDILAKVLEPIFVTLNSLPKSALAPLLIVWLGTGSKTIIIAGISVAIFGCIINLYTSFQSLDNGKQRLIYTIGGTKWDCFRHVILPGSAEQIFSNMKVNIGLSLVGVMIGEFLAAKRGLGYLIIYSSQVFCLDQLIMCIIILCIIAILLYELIVWLEKIVMKK